MHEDRFSHFDTVLVYKGWMDGWAITYTTICICVACSSRRKMIQFYIFDVVVYS